MKKSMIPIIFTCVAALAAIGTAIWQEIEKSKSDKLAEENQQKANIFQQEARENQQKADDYFKKLIEAGEENKKLNAQVNSKAEDIIKSNEKLIDAQSETIKMIMGYGYAWLGIFVKENQLQFHIESKSFYPIHNIRITIVDYNEIVKKYPVNPNAKEITFNEDFFNSNCISTSNSPITLKSKAIMDIPYTRPNNGIYYFLTMIKSQHNTTYQYSIIHCVPEKGGIFHSYKIFEVQSDYSLKLIEDHSLELPEELWINNFHYKQQLKMTSAKI